MEYRNSIDKSKTLTKVRCWRYTATKAVELIPDNVVHTFYTLSSFHLDVVN